MRPGVFPGGRVYYCEHGTPELVWRPQWQNHANCAQAIPEFVVASAAFEEEAEHFAKLVRSDVSGDSGGLGVALSGARISLMPPSSYGERYAALASPMAGRSSIFGALVFRTGDLDAVREVIATMADPVSVIDEPGRVALRESAFDCVLEFIE